MNDVERMLDQQEGVLGKDTGPGFGYVVAYLAPNDHSSQEMGSEYDVA